MPDDHGGMSDVQMNLMRQHNRSQEQHDSPVSHAHGHDTSFAPFFGENSLEVFPGAKNASVDGVAAFFGGGVEVFLENAKKSAADAQNLNRASDHMVGAGVTEQGYYPGLDKVQTLADTSVSAAASPNVPGINATNRGGEGR